MKTIKIKNAEHPLAFDYYITENGDVISGKYKRRLSTVLDKDGYVKVTLTSPEKKRHRYSVHRLMMENFCPRLDIGLLQVNHIDGDKQNNRLKNLEWCTCGQNIKHACENGLRHNQQGASNNASRYSEETILLAIDMLKSKKYTGAYIDKYPGFPKDYANMIRRKERWTHLTKDIEF